ncbi:NB-ARC domain-containing protein [Cephalotus follicularis]|uniref:NB-ARC domain-containing protein n=1 Tax=Cephalotus follicularis TaxID=3775 RepID=A0A1Q3BDH5_CEPFO|nr:NB-ARC domain-containing protein [Cephalotus follicularis]
MSTCRHWHTCAKAYPLSCITPLMAWCHPAWFVAMPTRDRGLCYIHNPVIDTWHVLSLDFVPHPIRLVASIGSLFLSRPTNLTTLQLGVCNPFARQFRQLPLLNVTRTNPAVGVVVLNTSQYGAFPYFRVYVAGGMSDAPLGGATYESTLEMYDSRHDTWQIVGCMPMEFSVRLTVWTPNESVYSNGVLYWMTSARAYSVMGLEIGSNTWREFSVPLAEKLEFATLVWRNEKLTLVGGTLGGEACVWELGDDDDDDMWSLIEKVPNELAMRFFGGKASWARTKCVGGEGAICLYRELGSGMLFWREVGEKGRWEWFWVDGCCFFGGKQVQNLPNKEIISSMAGAIGALEQASRNLDEAPKKIQSLEQFVCDLENLTYRIKQKHVYKLHNYQLDHQIQSLNALIERLHPKIRKARSIASQSKVKNLTNLVWTSMAGDPLGEMMDSITNDLKWWLESQKLVQDVEKMMESTAQDTPVQLKTKTEQAYPVSSKFKYVRHLLDQESSQRVILIVGLSGIGKSCLARQVASDPPKKFVSGATELGFGQSCSRGACNGSKAEYQKRLARKISKFLLQIGFWKKRRDESSDLEYVCCVLQEALCGKSILILLDDVWEQDIVERFANLYNNNCKFLVTTRNEAVYEITEAEKVELSKDDTREMSKSILLYHCLLSEEELPCVADSLLERCGHHPLTVAVMGKALRKEIRNEKWEKAISNLSTFATCAPGPVSYVNEKEAENTLTIFGSFEFSLEAMPEDSRRLFIASAALSWTDDVPEACLEAIWSVLGEAIMFPLIVCKLVEGSLLIKTDTDPLYQIHDMVSLYLDSKISNSIEILLNKSGCEETAFVWPWLLVFGKKNISELAEQRMEFFGFLEEKQAVSTLEAIIQALMASKSIPELEASRVSFSSILGPRIADLISTNSQSLIAVSAEAITNLFSESDYHTYFSSLEHSGAVERLAGMLDTCEDNVIKVNTLTVLAKLAEFGSPETVDKVIQSIPYNQLADLLSPDAEEWHENMFTILISLTKAGKSKAVERMVAFDIEKNLIKLLENGSEMVQHHAIITLKAFYELASKTTNASLQSANLNLLPWEVRLRLEGFASLERNVPPSSMPQTFEDLIRKLLSHDNKQVLEAMQDLIPILEKAGDPRMSEMIVKSPLIKRLTELLQCVQPEHNSMRSESAFLIMKLACSGGEPCIKKFLEYDTIPELIKMMQCQVAELQDSAYTALHQLLFSNGGVLVLNKIFQMGLIEKITQTLDSKATKTREVIVHCVLDIVELGNKASLERMLSLQVVEKLVKLEKASGSSGETVVGFLKGMDKCKHLSVAERRVMKQQVVRKVRAGLKGHKFETRLLAALDAYFSEGSRGASSSGRHRK